MNRLAILTLALVGPTIAPAASFSLGAVLRAGGLTDIELALGPTSGAPAVSGNLFPYWIEGISHPFQLSYDSTTNIASLSGNWLGIFISTISWNVAGGAPTSAARNWTLNPILLTAENNPATNTSIKLDFLSLTGPGLGLISPPTITAAQTGSGTVTATSGVSPITFTTPDGAGSWVLTGLIRFTGLVGAPGASGDQLRAAFDLTASDVPEPVSLLLAALGFAALGALHHLRQARHARMSPIIPVATPDRPIA